MTRHAPPRSIALRSSFAGACLTLVACLGCHQELPSLSMAESNSAGVDELPSLEDDEADSAKPQLDTRDLWFRTGPGREAILARERRDHASAISLLDKLLADPKLSSGDRAAAELLRALEHLRVDQFTEAAALLAQARVASALTPIEPYLRMLEAQARLDASESDAALKLVADLSPDLAAGVPVRVLLVKADAQARTNDRAGAITTYNSFLRQASGSDRHEARRKLAVLLLEGNDDDKRAAAKLFEQLTAEVPLSDYGVEADAELTKLEKAKLITRSKAERQRLARDQAKAEAERHLGQHSYGSAIAAVDDFIKHAKQHGADDGDRCEVLFVKGSAIFKMRKRTASQPVFDSAAKHCAKAGDVSLEVKSRYQAARGVYAAGKYEQAAARFEQLARDHADHSYADDCLIKAGESWESAGDPAKARAAYESSLAKHPGGDMYGEALRRLLVQAFSEGRLPDAVDLIDKSIAGGKVDGDELAKLHYFRGKALDRLGKGDEAEAAWLQTIETRPLSYPSLQALSRLRERSETAAAAGLAKISASSDAPLPELALPSTPTATRVKMWASLGLGDQARDELDAAAITGWPAVAVLAQAGLYSDAQRALASVGSSWRGGGPSGTRRQLWELAHPVPFRSLVDPGEQDHGVPALLTYAIMQSESRFNPGATSWAGARGLIQLMPETAKNVAQRAGLDVDPSQLYDPATNLDIGQRYLAGLTARWNNVDGAPALAVPSYNAGPGRTDEWLKLRGDWDLDLFVEAIPFDETRHYTQSVLGRWAAYRWLYGSGDDAARMPYIPLKIPK
ncbi:lytic transglycosylase domain-containing protein [Enhygromyxa salina]|uniref:Soluble lytic murein transglycosylase n=1 Tax=Enhygromyxa salina TaxID=215803 RepID=A0A2S9XU39_9BACT|nr:transglycosylase SLT domain-containing protein [Enhygromyxa salina]PRP96363.1 Soluble lytic murein transglycosylase precursor [Enhygromyxa salina]